MVRVPMSSPPGATVPLLVTLPPAMPVPWRVPPGLMLMLEGRVPSTWRVPPLTLRSPVWVEVPVCFHVPGLVLFMVPFR